MPQLDADFPEKLGCLFNFERYAVLRGGRGSTKSWSVARWLLLRGASAQPIRWLCAREFQNSIRDSVHKLLSDQIQKLGLGSCYEVEKQAIYGRRYYPVIEDGKEIQKRTEFTFAGLSDQTAESIKSFEGYDGAWVEEAQVLTERSLNILTPTIRRPGSQIVFTYNPELDTDAIHKFADSLGDNSVVVDINWRDNPWFNDVLEAERQRAQRTMSKIDYENIWEGKCRPAVSGAIYAQEIATMLEQRRVGDFPYDPFHLVYPVFDLGWNDHMVIGLWQRNVSQLRLIDYIEDDHKTLDWYSRELRQKPYSYGRIFLPHDGGHGDYKTGKTAQEILEGLKWTVHVLPKIPPEDGIRAARMTLSQVFADREKCAGFVEHLKRYRRSIPKTTNEPAAPVHDVHSHAADMYRYSAQAAPLMDDDDGMKLPDLVYPTGRPV